MADLILVLIADGALPRLTPDGLTELIGACGRIAGGTIIPPGDGPPGPPGPPVSGPLSPFPIPTADTRFCVSARLLVCCCFPAFVLNLEISAFEINEVEHTGS